MSFNRHVFLSAFTVVILAIAVCFRFFGEVILHPDEFLFEMNGDGLKNYFSVAYQVIHGDGMWFNGMLYPYGDHLIFADGQPLLTKILSWFIEPHVNNGTTIIGIMNLLMLSGLVLTAWCVHRLLVWNYVNPWFAVPFSLTIAFLSPQLARFVGHYALAYTFFVPLSWLLIAAFQRYERSWLTALVASAIVLIFGFLHPYYLFIFVIFLGAVIGWDLLINRFKLKSVGQIWPKLFALLVPLILFMVYQKTANIYTDRPTSPAGVFSYMATFQSVFLPVADPFHYLFNTYFFRVFLRSSWEGNAYIGFVASFTAFASAWPFVKRVLKRKWKVLTHPVLPPTLKATFIPGVLTLLFAMGLFHNLGLYWLSDFISPLKQFRSLGRVAWIFYYVFAVWTVYHLYVLFRHFRSIGKGRYTYHVSLIIGLCAFIWMLDAIVNIKFNKARMIEGRSAKEVFSDKYATEWKNAKVGLDAYQAIVPLPFKLVGSEKIGLDGTSKAMLYAWSGSFSTGLPLIGGAMSRTSLDVTERSAQLVSDPLFLRKILEDLLPEKKILLLWTKEPLNPNESLLISNADTVFENEKYMLLSTDIERIRDRQKQHNQRWSTETVQENGHYRKPIKYDQSTEDLWGEAAFQMESYYDIIDSVFTRSETLNLSYWVKVEPDKVLLPNRIYVIDQEWKKGGGIGNSPNLLDGWLFVSEELVTEAGKHHRYAIESRPGLISRIQLRKAGEAIIHHEGETVFVNNVPQFPTP